MVKSLSKRTRLSTMLALVTLGASIVVLQASPAYAACGSMIHQAVGGHENSTTRLGDLASVQVNTFAANQNRTWRAVAVLKNASNFGEAGWFLDAITYGNQLKHPYKTWVSNGVANTMDFAGVSLSSGMHEFKTHDQNHDHAWSFAYDGTAMGNQTINMDWGDPVTEAERDCTNDSLIANFTGLKQIGCTNCGWVAYNALSRFINSTTLNPFVFCKDSNTQYHVKVAC